MTTLHLSPLTNTEVYERTDRARSLVSRYALDGAYEPDHYWRDAFAKAVERLRVLADAEAQRCGLRRLLS